MAVPGGPRFGYRFTEKVPRKALVLPGVDIPVEVDGARVQIPWDLLAKMGLDPAMLQQAAGKVQAVAGAMGPTQNGLPSAGAARLRGPRDAGDAPVLLDRRSAASDGRRERLARAAGSTAQRRDVFRDG
jgi:hypothetical protein